MPSPAEVLKDTKNFTFTLEGSPAFASITDYRWLDEYTREIDTFAADVEGYSRSAWKEREGWQVTQKPKWAGNRFREIITSDQDLVSHLIHTSRIIQDDTKSFCAQSKLFYTVNPLYIFSHAPMQLHKANGLRFTIADSCFLEDRKIAIWHFQANFVRYINHFLFLRRIHYPFRVPNELQTSRFIRAALKRISGHFSFSRLQIYRMLKELNRNRADAGVSFGEIFNSRKFWKKDTFG